MRHVAGELAEEHDDQVEPDFEVELVDAEADDPEARERLIAAIADVLSGRVG